MGVAPGDTGASTQAPTPKGRGSWAFLLIALVVLAGFVVAVPYAPAAIKQGSDIFSQLASTLPGGPGNNTTSTTTSVENPQCSAVATDHTQASPDIHNGSASVWYPTDYCTIVTDTLAVINQDRATNGSAPITLDYNKAAQQHSDSMLQYGYFSHFDVQGLKPYMRYSMLGGLGGDFENVAYLSYNVIHFTSTSSVEEAVKTLERSMMYNDSACCNNGHRDNILDPLHNKVSLGVAYNGTTVMFDEEFENDYINLSFTAASGSATNPYFVTMTGTPVQGSPVPIAVYIAFDPTPSAETTAALNSGPHEYGPGSLLGGILPSQGFPPSCGQFTSGITVCATTWVYSHTQVDIRFSIQDFVKSQGPGVYTVYLVTSDNTNSALTTISVFVP